jgi:AdoMet-dependent heme synthase
MPPLRILSRPATFALELTSQCNNRCVGCSNVYHDARTTQVMSAASWADLLSSFADDAVHIRLTGGEPTLHPDFFAILETATAYRAWVTIFTNGRWQDPQTFVERVRGWPRLAGLLISLHGAHPASHEAFTGVPGSFAETVQNIRLAVDRGIIVALSTVLTHHSWNEVRDVVGFVDTLGIDHVAFNRFLGAPIEGVNPHPDELRAALQTIEELRHVGAPVKYGVGIPQCFMPNSSQGCLAGVAYVSIDPWGRVRPCAHSPTVVGSLRSDSLDTIWHGEAMNTWRDLMPAECPSCAAYTDCHGGCRAVIELRKDHRDPLRGVPLTTYNPPPETHELPADIRPIANLRLRHESFGYVALGEYEILPVSADARSVIMACDGSATFAQLAARFGQPGLDLLGDLWYRGMLRPA